MKIEAKIQNSKMKENSQNQKRNRPKPQIPNPELPQKSQLTPNATKLPSIT